MCVHFAPDQPVTRQQFAKMIDLAMQVEVTEADICPFPDVELSVSPEFYPDHYVAVAAEHGFAHGYDDGTFRPTDSITREQVVTMAVRALENMWPDMLTEPEPSQTSPWGDFDPDHGPNAVKAWANGLLWPVPMDELGPWEPMSRGEVAQVLDNVAMMVDFAGMP